MDDVDRILAEEQGDDVDRILREEAARPRVRSPNRVELALAKATLPPQGPISVAPSYQAEDLAKPKPRVQQVAFESVFKPQPEGPEAIGFADLQAKLQEKAEKAQSRVAREAWRKVQIPGIPPEEVEKSKQILRDAISAGEKIHPTKPQNPAEEESGPGWFRAVTEAWPRARAGFQETLPKAFREEVASNPTMARLAPAVPAVNAATQALFAGGAAALNPSAPVSSTLARERVEREGTVSQAPASFSELTRPQIVGTLGYAALKPPEAQTPSYRPGYLGAEAEAALKGAPVEQGRSLGAGEALLGALRQPKEAIRRASEVGITDRPGTMVKKLEGRTPAQAALEEGIIDAITDPTALVAGPVIDRALLPLAGKAIGTAGKAASAVLKRAPAIEEKVDEARRWLGGPSQAGAILERDLSRAGLSPVQGEAAKAMAAAGPATNIALAEKVAPAVEGLKKVAPSRWQDAWNALELPQGHPMKDIAYARLAPQERQAVDYAKLVQENQGLEGQRLFNLALREEYAPHRLTPAVRESRMFPEAVPTSTRAAPPIGHPGSYAKQRTLPEELSELTGEPIVTPQDVNRIMGIGPGTKLAPEAANELAGIKAGMERHYPGWKVGEPLFQESPAAAAAERLTRGAADIEKARAVRGAAEPYLVSGTPRPGYVTANELSVRSPLAGRALAALKNEQGLKGEAQIPAALANFLVREEAAPSGFMTQLSRAMGPWKSSVTVHQGLGYHLRNFLTSAIKIGGRYGYGRVGELYDAARQVQEGKLAPGVLKAYEAAGFGKGAGVPSLNQAAILRQAGATTQKPLGGARLALQKIGEVAGATDDRARIAAVLGRMEENGGKLDEAIDFAGKFITHTGNKTPAERAISEVAPFYPWTVRELTNRYGVPAEIARGHLNKPTYLQRTMEEVARAQGPYAGVPGGGEQPPSKEYPRGISEERGTYVEPSQLSERIKEQQGFPLGVRGERGPMYLPIPGGPLATMGPEANLLEKRDRDALARYLRAKAMPPYSVAADILTGTDPFGKPLDIPATASGYQKLLKLAEEKTGLPMPLTGGVVHTKPGGEDRFTSTGWQRSASMAIPWGWLPRMLLAETPELKGTAALQMAGLPPVTATPGFEGRTKARELEELMRKRRLELLPLKEVEERRASR